MALSLGHLFLGLNGDDIRSQGSILVQRLQVYTADFDQLSLYLARLSDSDVLLLRAYFYLTDLDYQRAIDLKYKLLASSIHFNIPEFKTPLIRDYVSNFYDTQIESLQLPTLISATIFSYVLFGSAFLLVTDDYPFLDDSPRITTLDTYKPSPLTEDRLSALESLSDSYITSEHITTSELSKALKFVFKSINSKYNGFKSIQVVSPLNVRAVSANTLLNYVEYGLDVNSDLQASIDRLKSLFSFLDFTSDSKISELFTSKLSEEQASFLTSLDLTFDSLKDTTSFDFALKVLGALDYSLSYIEAHLRSDGSTILLDNDPFSGAYLIDVAPSTQVIDGRAKFLASIPVLLRNKSISARLNKLADEDAIKLNIIQISPANDSQVVTPQDVTDLDNKIGAALSGAYSATGAIVSTNYEVDVKGVSILPYDYDSLSNERKTEVENIYRSLSLPPSLANESSSGSYGANYLKYELLAGELADLRADLKRNFDSLLLQPLAVKKRFITADAFGNPKLLPLTLKMQVGSLINSSGYLDLIKDLNRDDKVSTKTLFDLLGLNVSDEANQIKTEKELYNKDSNGRY